jgi:hypothetical protein
LLPIPEEWQLGGDLACNGQTWPTVITVAAAGAAASAQVSPALLGFGLLHHVPDKPDDEANQDESAYDHM